MNEKIKNLERKLFMLRKKFQSETCVDKKLLSEEIELVKKQIKEIKWNEYLSK